MLPGSLSRPENHKGLLLQSHERRQGSASAVREPGLSRFAFSNMPDPQLQLFWAHLVPQEPRVSQKESLARITMHIRFGDPDTINCAIYGSIASKSGPLLFPVSCNTMTLSCRFKEHSTTMFSLQLGNPVICLDSNQLRNNAYKCSRNHCYHGQEINQSFQ